MIIAVKRQELGGTPYWQEFDIQLQGRTSVAGILQDINSQDDVVDAQGKPARRIRWACSCMQKICGACAMVINGVPALACATFVEPNEQRVTVEPLSKFFVVEDLTIDRSPIFCRMREAELYLGTFKGDDPKEHETQYEAATCLKCGLCLEVCPNYVGPDGRFGGAVLANEAYLMASSTADRKRDIKKSYNKAFAAGCSKSLACREVCPMKIRTLSTIGYMNR